LLADRLDEDGESIAERIVGDRREQAV